MVSPEYSFPVIVTLLFDVLLQPLVGGGLPLQLEPFATLVAVLILLWHLIHHERSVHCSRNRKSPTLQEGILRSRDNSYVPSLPSLGPGGGVDPLAAMGVLCWSPFVSPADSSRSTRNDPASLRASSPVSCGKKLVFNSTADPCSHHAWRFHSQRPCGRRRLSEAFILTLIRSFFVLSAG